MTLRHAQPPEMPDVEWAKIVAWGKCPLCQGRGIQPAVRLPTGRKTETGDDEVKVFPRNVFFWKAPSGRVYAACLDGTCNLWADATEFVKMDKRFGPEPIASCASGHGIKMHFQLERA